MYTHIYIYEKVCANVKKTLCRSVGVTMNKQEWNEQNDTVLGIISVKKRPFTF